ncbi:MAG: hypothetical protein EOM62_20945, partial [Bacteroidia bacterium]|nr:hypothetical protein [Bacteroidia bacterium]
LYTNSILTYGVNFHNCIFDKYVSVNSRYIYTNFFDCTFLGCDFVYSEFDSCSFNHCDIRKSRLSYSDFHESYIYKSYMAGVDLSYSDIDEVYISNTEIDSSSIIPMIDETDFRKDVVGWAFGLTDVGVPVICKLLVPGDAEKSISYKHAYRCSKARVLEVQRMDGTDSHLSARFVSEHGSIQRFVGNICFSNGEMLVSGAWGENVKYCTDGGGIKFYLSRDYAVRAARRYVDIRGDVAGFDGDGNRLPSKEGNEENEE